MRSERFGKGEHFHQAPMTLLGGIALYEVQKVGFVSCIIYY